MTALLSEEGEERRISEARRWLSAIKGLMGHIARMEQAAQAQYERADNLKGLDYGGARVASSPYADAIPDAVALHMEFAESFREVADSARERVRAATKAIAGLDDGREASVLMAYYVDNGDGMPAETWEDACKALGFGRDTAKAVHRRALLHVYELMPHTERSRVESAY